MVTQGRSSALAAQARSCALGRLLYGVTRSLVRLGGTRTDGTKAQLRTIHRQWPGFRPKNWPDKHGAGFFH